MFTDDFQAYDDAGGRTFIHARGNRAFRRVTAAMVVSGFSGAVGNTPLIELRELSRELGRRVLGKAEFLNPGGSVKDRAARGIVDDAEARGALQPGGTIVEGTAGNTGIALALVANERGYKSVIVVPDDQSREKIELLRAYGSDVRVVPAVAFTNPQNYYHVASRIAQETPGAFWANQFENLANRRAHEATTGPEIWEQGGGRIDAFVAAAGTGGTIAGVASALKTRREAILTVLCDPMGSALYNYVNNGELKPEGDSDLEGIGIKRLTANFEGAPVDRAIRVTDAQAVAMAHWLLEHDGIFVGGSSGLNVVGAAMIARGIPAGSTVVTILCDGGGRYLSRIFNDAWMRENNFAKGQTLTAILGSS
ncbi:MAG: cysteine synthase A [Candidatus Cybelea sp.]|jgi:cysteine synthase A